MFIVSKVKYLVLNNAYVSDMREDLNFQGNQLNIINTGTSPSALAPRIFPACIVAWELLTLGTDFCHHPWQIMAVRFFQAVFESSTFVGCHYILGSWCKEDELFKRTAIFTSSGLAGTLFSGFLQGSIHSGLGGVHGLPGWQWLFIDFCITIPVAIYGFFAFPDTPESTTAWWLTDKEKRLAFTRLPEVEKHRGVLGWSLISRVNYIPTGVAAVGILATLTLGYSDFTKRSWHVGIILSITAITLQPPSRDVKFFALFLNGCQYVSQTVFFAWANSLTRDDAKRVISGAMNTFGIAVYMFWSLLFYPGSRLCVKAKTQCIGLDRDSAAELRRRYVA
ncbi:major facilitator superfamily domain-containing protein [Stachybotrys elegans]|uniref:Major facilitator superfamily domain-containing protein n=1 Tax=Stachybotrys elegans TaxID=80388 RepID=A0A8K0WKI8_9HYPO|nr:major facilitator superfamily domain-containing protein [Stachybotrys elegans]